jgi:hypothetical protein
MVRQPQGHTYGPVCSEKSPCHVAEQTLKSTDAVNNTDRDRLQPHRHDDGQFCALEASSAVEG